MGALEPLEGIWVMRLNRGIEHLRDLVRGPGRPTAALRVGRRLDGLDLCRECPRWRCRSALSFVLAGGVRRVDQAATVGRLTIRSKVNGAIISTVM